MFLEKNRDRIEKDFEDFSRELPQKAEEIKKRMEALNADIVIGMKYLYSNMPYSDIGNYTFDTYLDYVQQGICLWENSPYVKKYPELYFLNYVLFHRTNDEEIKPCRTFFWEKIKERIQGMNMMEAALEINHWCAGEVMYQGTDMRTGSALEIYRSGVGRCGEQAVFVVNVLRSAGIPARMVYVPRWSHRDDNHAWVEVWCDGDWHYLGACEPEPVLDKGWFTGEVSRAMMICSRWYDRAMPDEEVIGKVGMNRILNLLGRYAKTRRITIQVEDLDGMPAAGAKVQAEVMNYGGFSPVAQMLTDENGCISFETGLGSLLICAVYEGAYGEKVVDTREAERFVCTLGEEYADELWVDFDMNAPEENCQTSWDVSKEQEKENNLRVAAEAEHCREKIEKFQPLWKRCLFGHTLEEVEPMMAVLSEKDRRDAFPEVLEGHYQEASVYREFNPDEIYIPYVWNPRVENEVLTKWRKKILGCFDKKQRDAFEADPKRIWTWIQENISVRNDKEHLTAYTTPGAALDLKIAGEKSQKVLFVAIARSLGIPSRLSPTDGAIEYWDGMKFVAVLEKSRKEAHLVVIAEKSEDWVYHQNWTLAVTDGQGYLTLDFGECTWKDGKLELDIMPGDYRILTGSRLPDGNILGKRYDFHIEKNEVKKVELELRVR
ncbi:MAG: transglutaminase domain-containing protein [Clostridia bacterium]|nr:transglutaminase domain-containing protein [Clostridia bacterium]